MNRHLAAVLLAALAAPVVAAPRTVPTATPVGPAVDCVPIVNLRSEVRSDQVIDVTSGRRVWRNTLPQECPSLGFDRAFGYATSLSQLCSTDIITVIRQGAGGMRGRSCGLGRFQPVTLDRSAK